ncbi:hypothetical protein MXB_3386 [Myxobolus squamalis]|nr:hypothetical protein MXB_3386 [Myxobolus squamalis]
MYSGQVIFSKLHMALFNVSYTSLPPLCFGLLDQSCSLEAHYNVPYLYESLRKSSPFGVKRFFCWTMNGVLHSFFVFFLCYFLCHKGVISGDGIPISIGLFGNIVFMHTLIVITLKAALELRFWFWMSHIGIFVGFASYLIFLAIFSRRFPPMIWIEPEFFETDLQMIYSLQFWAALIGLPLISLFPDFINWTEPENIRTIQSELDRSCEIKSRRTKKYFGFAFSVTENVNLKKFFPRHAIKPKPASYQAIPVE